MKFKSINFLFTLGALCMSFTGFSGFTVAQADVSSRPILFVHGFNVFGIGEDCSKDWSKMEQGLTAQGFTGQKITIGYYFNDRNCDVVTSPKGTILTSIEDISHDLAWYIYNTFSSQGVDVDVVAHSMGGLALRYALYQVSVGDSSYPPFLKITHATTMGTPYTGYSLLAESCHIVVVNYQCDEMFPLSGFIEGLKNPQALVPQGVDGTIWAGIGSNADFFDSSDGLVGSASATSMDIAATNKIVLPWHMFVFHTLYTNNKTVIADVAQYLAQTEAAPSVAHASAKMAHAELPSRELASADAVLSREDVAQDFSQASSSQAPAKTEPQFENNEAVGIHVTNILPSGIFAQMGIQEGDVVRGCNSENINNPFEALDTLESSTGPISMHFCIVRGGEKIAKHIVIR
jgi:hypothetical protein